VFQRRYLHTAGEDTSPHIQHFDVSRDVKYQYLGVSVYFTDQCWVERARGLNKTTIKMRIWPHGRLDGRGSYMYETLLEPHLKAAVRLE
jgi:hypothetical protein